MADEKVIVTKTKLDALATSISEKSGVATPMTIAQMKAAVDGIFTGNVTQDADGYLVLDKDGTGSGKLMYSLDDYATRSFDGDVILNTATLIEELAFYNTSIASVSGNAPKKIRTGAFRYCTKLTKVNFPNVTDISYANYAFANCTNLIEIKLPKLSNIMSSTNLCENCPSLQIADLGLISGMTNSFFNKDTALRILILRKTGSICTTNWANSTVFGGIYNNPTESTIYVPSALISAYETATNWSTLKDMGVTFSALENSIYN